MKIAYLDLNRPWLEWCSKYMYFIRKGTKLKKKNLYAFHVTSRIIFWCQKLLTGKQHQDVTKDSIKRIYNKNWSCDIAIFILDDSWVGDITEKLYFSSINGTIPWVRLSQLSVRKLHYIMRTINFISQCLILGVIILWNLEPYGEEIVQYTI